MLSTRRLTIVLVGIAMAMLTVVLRTAQVQVFAYSDYAGQVNERLTQSYAISAPRGKIYDRNGNLLAVSNRVYLVRFNFGAVTDTMKLATVMSPVVMSPVEGLRNRMDAIIADRRNMTPTLSTVLILGIAPSVAHSLTLAVRTAGLDGLYDPEEYWARTYPQGKLAGTILGFVNLQPKGYSGIEGYYNQSLGSTPGGFAELGRQNLLGITLTQQGADVVLTLDMTLQRYVEDRLQQAMLDYGPKGGSILVMDTKTGAILASASAPGYDPNKAVEIASQPGAKLFDPAVTSLYEPGSVIKLLTTAAAFQHGTITEGKIYQDEVKLNIGGKYIYNSDRGAHGKVDVEDMLRLSLNVIAAKVAIEMGPEKFYKTFHLFGMGAKSGVDLAGEQTGVLRTPQSEDWSKADLATNSYGQGMSATPLQVLTAMNAIANDGVLVQPYAVQEWRVATAAGRSETSRQIVPVQRVISPDVAQRVRRLMQQATHAATPKALLDGYTVAGKTGTADWYENGIKQDSTYVTYIGMVPAEQPRITILVKFDQPKAEFRWASDSTVPVFHDVAAKAVQVLGIPAMEEIAR